MKYWINTITKEHVLKGIGEGFTQANHGSDRNLKKMSEGDAIVFYSGKESFSDNTPYQKFTAMGNIIDDHPYQVEMTPDFHPYRRNISFISMKEASIRPLIDELSFIQDPKHWGFPFMRGLFEIPRDDFVKIALVCDVNIVDLEA